MPIGSRSRLGVRYHRVWILVRLRVGLRVRFRVGFRVKYFVLLDSWSVFHPHLQLIICSFIKVQFFISKSLPRSQALISFIGYIKSDITHSSHNALLLHIFAASERSSFIFLIGILICAILVCQDDFEHA